MAYDNSQLQKVPNSSKCIEWNGTISKMGYAVCYKDFKQYRVARLLMLGIYKSIDNNLVIDHICNNRSCVNTAHLQVLTNKQNVLKGSGVTALNLNKTHCKRGHELSGYNLKKRPLGRSCRKCINDMAKLRRDSVAVR